MTMNGIPFARPMRGLVIERLIDAPRERVFKAWTEPHQVMKWWAPQHFVVTFCVMDLRPRGRWSVCMRSPEGIEYWTRGVYRDVCEPEMLVVSLSWPGSDADPPMETMVSLSFAEEGDKTRLTFEQTIFEAV